MATSILGTFPILNFKKSQTDEYGFDYVSYQFTIETEPLTFTYSIPKKDDVFLGYLQKAYSGTVGYVVDTVETNNINGGLTELAVNTVGSKNTAELNTPRVTLISGGPLIFGLSGTAAPSQFQIEGYGKSGAGQSVEIKFLANGGASGQQQIFTTHFNSVMPTTFRGISLPAPARAPGQFSNETYPESGGIQGTAGEYYGFICKTILTEKRGSLLLVTLTYSEAGFAYSWSGSGNTATNLYYFPRVG